MAHSSSTLSTLWHHWGPPLSPWKQQSIFVIYSYSVLHTALLTQFEFSHRFFPKCQPQPSSLLLSGEEVHSVMSEEGPSISGAYMLWFRTFGLNYSTGRKVSKKEKDGGAELLLSSQAFSIILASLFTLCTSSEIDGAAASLSAPFLQALSSVCVCECVCALSALWHLSWPIFSRVYHLTS